MIRLALILALVIAGAVGAQTDLERQKDFSMPPFTDDVAGDFRAVGRVNRGGFRTAGGCSGTLIRPDVVLTAGHCAGHVPLLPKTAESTTVFVAGYKRGDYIAASRVMRAVRHPAYRVTGKHDPRFDIGLLFLLEPITEVAPLPLADPREDADTVALAGYHRFIPHLLSGRLDCPVIGRNMWLVRIDCPVVSGNSGGPVLEPDGAGGWQVTGVVSSQEKRSDSLRAIAVRIPQWVHDVLAER